MSLDLLTGDTSPTVIPTDASDGGSSSVSATAAAETNSPSSPTSSSSSASQAIPPPPQPDPLPSSHAKYSSISSNLESISDDVVDELKDELKAKKIDVGAVRDLLRFHLARQMEAVDEVQALKPAGENPLGFALPLDLLQKFPLVPAATRSTLWPVLLGCHYKDPKLLDGFDVERITQKDDSVGTGALSKNRPAKSPAELREEEEEERRPSVITHGLRNNINIDAKRTRSAMFGQEKLVEELEQLLVFYCYSRGVEYKQGLNEILAPILMCMSQATPTTPSTLASVPRGPIYNAFYALISKFLPSIFNDGDFENLRCLFRLFRLLFLYHEPALAKYIDEQCGILPELYATHWFLTLFSAQGCDSLDTLYALWDCYFIEDDPFLQYFIALALLRSQKRYLLETPEKYLPMALRKLQITSTSLLPLLKEAKKLRANTPTSFRTILFEISFMKKNNGLITANAASSNANVTGGILQSAMAALQSAMSPSASNFLASSALTNHLLEQFASYCSLLPCLSVPAAEIVQQAYSDLTDEGQIKYILLDVRSAAEFQAGHLPCAIHISPSVLHIPSKLAALISDKQYGGMKECHFNFIGAQSAAFAEVQTTLVTSSGGGHELNLPSSRRPVPPPSPASSLAALAENARAEEALLRDGLALDGSVAVKDVSGSSEQKPATDAAVALSPSPSPSSSPTGVLYRPPTPDLLSGTAPVETTAAASSSPAKPNSAIQTSPLLDSSLASFVAFFLKSGFTHVSVCEGGYPAVHALVAAQQAAYKAQRKALADGKELSQFQTPLENMELVDHNAKLCHVCTPPPEIPAPVQVLDFTPSTPAHDTPEVKLTTPPAASETATASDNSTPKASSTPIAKDAPADSSAPGSKPGSPPPVAEPVAKEDPKPSSAASALSKFSLGFKSLKQGLSEKFANYKAQAEKERAAESAAWATEKIASLKLEKERELKEKEEKERNAAEAKAKAAESANFAVALLSSPSNVENDKETQKEKEKEREKEKEKEKQTEKEKEKEKAKEKEKEKEKSTSTSTASTGSFASRFFSSLGLKKKEKTRSVLPTSPKQTSELNSTIDLSEWAEDTENIALFHCHEISLLPPSTPTATASPSSATSGSTPTAPEPSKKRQGLLLPRVLAVTAGYVITFQPAKRGFADLKKGVEGDDSFGPSYLKAKYRLIDLDKITSKKEKPSVLTFHWKATPETIATAALLSPTASGSNPPLTRLISAPGEMDPPPTPSGTSSFQTTAPASHTPSADESKKSTKGPSIMFLVNKPKECIALVRAKFLLAKASAELAASNKHVPTREEEEEIRREIERNARMEEEAHEVEDAAADDHASTFAGSTEATASGPASSPATGSSQHPTIQASPTAPIISSRAPRVDSPPFLVSPVNKSEDLSDLLDL